MTPQYEARADRIALLVRRAYAVNRALPSQMGPEQYALMVAWPLWRLVRLCLRNRDPRLFVMMVRERWRWRGVR
jgi:hypothetical protein